MTISSLYTYVANQLPHLEHYKSFYDPNGDDRYIWCVLYSIDWKATLVWGKPLSGVIWTKGAHCPQASFNNEGPTTPINPSDYLVLDFVVETVRRFSTVTELYKLVYSTYPMFTASLGDKLDLSSSSKDYREVY